MVLIPKPGNSGVRPISLLSCLLKTLEKMIYSRLLWFVESRHILPDSQLGFRPDRSCIDSLVILTSEIYKGFINNISTVCAFLDIKGAFDNVIPNILIQDLKDIGIPACTRKFILNLTCERQLHFVMDGRKIGPFLSHKGTPQGSTLSPLLFAIYLKDIIKHLHHESKILLYADDIVVFSTAANIHLAHRSVQNTLDQVSAFLRYRGLDLSPDKSQWMIFTRNRILFALLSLTVFNRPISRVNKARFLGIILDPSLSGKEHLQYLLQKGSVIIDIITSLSGTWWGSHPHLLINLYRSIFRGSIEYGCQIFRFHGIKSSFIKLERLQYRAIRVAMGYRVSTPINVMLYEAKEVPLKLRFNLLTRKFLIKCFAREFNPVIESLDALRLAARHRNARIHLLRLLPIFRHFIYISHYRNTGCNKINVCP